MATRTQILVSALMDGDKLIVPETFLGRNVEYHTADGHPLTAAEYQKFNPPTLAVSTHAFFGRNPDGSFVSPDYRQSVRSKRGYGEWTSTFLRDGTEAVERPDRVFYHEKSRIWIAEGGKVSKVELQPDGWVLEYDKLTGFPISTSPNKADAEKIFGGDASRFYSSRNGLRAVLRNFGLGDGGPFYVDADFGPGCRDSGVGVRSLRRSEQDAERPATPMYVMGQLEYDKLIRLSQGNKEIGELLSRIELQK